MLNGIYEYIFFNNTLKAVTQVYINRILILQPF